MLPNDVAFAVNDEGMGYVDNIHCTLKVLVLVDIDFVFPAVAVNVGLYARGGTGVVDGDCNQFYASLFLPFLIDLFDGVIYTGIIPFLLGGVMEELVEERK